MTSYPTLREKVERVLLAAGFRAYGEPIPTRGTSGTFYLSAGAGVEVRVEWWDVTDDQRWELLGQMREALTAAGYLVTPGRLGLYVADPDKRSDEE